MSKTEANVTKELLPCPFCGGEPTVRSVDDGDIWWRIECSVCECRTEFVPSPHGAREVWNRRTGEDAPVRRESEAERECVRWFASIMERELRENDHKGGWERERIVDLLDRIYDEAFELLVAIDCPGGGRPERIIQEAADVANFAMMIADNTRRSAPRSLKGTDG